jgi:hypothetical protein
MQLHLVLHCTDSLFPTDNYLHIAQFPRPNGFKENQVSGLHVFFSDVLFQANIQVVEGLADWVLAHGPANVVETVADEPGAGHREARGTGGGLGGQQVLCSAEEDGAKVGVRGFHSFRIKELRTERGKTDHIEGKISTYSWLVR